VTILSSDGSRELFTKWARIFKEQSRARATAPEPSGDRIADETLITGVVVENDAYDYRAQIIKLLLALPASGFERLSQRLLREAGFTQVVVTGSSGDGGIDGYGTLQVNPLVSFKVLFQCKRYSKSVSPSQVRDFRGAMAGRADKGIIITTGTFTAEARREASRDGVAAIEFIDGEKLIEMLEELELGLTPVKAFEVDEVFFREFTG
jgi:restriction system protein